MARFYRTRRSCALLLLGLLLVVLGRIARSAPPIEQDALLDIRKYGSFSDDEWIKGRDCGDSSWQGVKCNANGYVSELDLGVRQISVLPASIGNFTMLGYLELTLNKISILPESLGNLKNLQYLSLTFNKLSTLPESFGSLTSLSGFNIGANQLSGFPESIKNLPRLQSIDASGNQLSTLPKSFGNLTTLTQLQIGYNNLSTLPEFIGNLRKLQLLDLRNNSIQTLPESIGKLSNLLTLDASMNRLTTVPESMGNLTNLVYLLLNSNWISTLPKSVQSLPKLQSFNVVENCLKDFPSQRPLSECSSSPFPEIHAPSPSNPPFPPIPQIQAPSPSNSESLPIDSICYQFSENPCGLGSCVGEGNSFSCACPTGYNMVQRPNGKFGCIPQLLPNSNGNQQSSCVSRYTVVPGDTCKRIEHMFRISHLEKVNTGLNCSALTPFQSVCIKKNRASKSSLLCMKFKTVNPLSTCFDLAKSGLPMIQLFLLNPGLYCYKTDKSKVCIRGIRTSKLLNCHRKIEVSALDTCSTLYAKYYGGKSQKFRTSNYGAICDDDYLYAGLFLCLPEGAK